MSLIKNNASEAMRIGINVAVFVLNAWSYEFVSPKTTHVISVTFMKPEIDWFSSVNLVLPVGDISCQRLCKFGHMHMNKVMVEFAKC